MDSKDFDDFIDYTHRITNDGLIESLGLLQRARKRGFICPECSNGSGEDGDGLILNPKQQGRYKCFVCGKSFDLIDLVGICYNLTGYERIAKTADLLHYALPEPVKKSVKSEPIPWNGVISDTAFFADAVIAETGEVLTPIMPEFDGEEQKKVVPSEPEQPTKTNAGRLTEPELEKMINALTSETGIFDDIIKDAEENLKGSEAALKYLKEKRGLTDRAIKEFGLGYVSNYHGAFFIKDGILIPNSQFGFAIRNMNRETTEKKRWLNNSTKEDKAICLPLGLKQVINQPNDKRNPITGYIEPIFVCEGHFDAISFYEVGADAVALIGTGNDSKVIEALKHFKIDRPIIVALDNDKAGIKRQEEIIKNFKDAKFTVFPADTKKLYGGFKDANEFWTEDPQAFKREVTRAKTLTQESFEKSLTINQAGAMKEFINKSLEFPPILTGFDILDSKDYLDGGLYQGLYIIGAMSALGKTSFILQIADNIAAQGTPVLYFSLEMSKFELMARSISRYSYQNTLESYFLKEDAVTVRQILDKRRQSNFSESQRELMEQSWQNYFKAVGRNLLFCETTKKISYENITSTVEDFKRITGRAPVVFVDYLQLLGKPQSVKSSMTDKQIVDENVFALKNLSRDHNIPIITISSFNRENYNQPVGMTSFKESGAIEYSSDVLIGLENQVILPPNFDLMSSKQKHSAYIIAKQRAREKFENDKVKDVRLEILKNRNGKAGGEITLSFTAMFNHYREYDLDEWKRIKKEEIAERQKLGLLEIPKEEIKKMERRMQQQKQTESDKKQQEAPKML